MSLIRPSSTLRHAFRHISVSNLLRPRLAFENYTCPPRSRSICVSVPRFQNPQPLPALKTCPSCAKPLPSPVPACTSCWNIFSLPPGVTHHELFGLPYEPNPFVVDLSTLKQRFRQVQAACHPDTWASRGPNKQDIAHALSARVNEGYQALLRPLARAEYILSRNDLSISEDDKADDMGFMIGIMEARELIDEAEDVSQVSDLMEENDDKISEAVHQLEGLVGQQDWTGVKATAIRLRYLEGISRAAKKWLDSR